MRFAVITAALLTLATSVIASPGSSFTTPSGGDKLQCRRINRVEWKGFEWKKKIVWLVVTDKLNRVITSRRVNPKRGSADVFIPEFFQRTAKLAIVDVDNKAIFESGEEISIDCDKKRKDGDQEGDGDFNDFNDFNDVKSDENRQDRDGEGDWKMDDAL